MAERRLSVLWAIDHVCYDGSLHGGGRLYMNLLPTMEAHGIDVHPFFLRSSPEVAEVFEAARSPVRDLNRGKFDPRTLLDLAGCVRRHDVRVMHLMCYAASTFGRLVGIASGVPAILHDFDTQVYFPYPLYLALSDRLLARRSAWAFAASDTCRTYMSETRRIPADRISLFFHVIPEEVERRARTVSAAEGRARLGIAQDALVYCCVTKLGPERGNDTLMRAFRRVVDEHPAARLLLVYKPTLYHVVPEAYRDIPWIRDTDAMRAHLNRRIEELDLGNHVTVLESLDDPTDALAAADVFVAPFRNVRFSSVNLVEALAFGLPAVVSGLGELGEVVRHEQEGLHVAPGDDHELARALGSLADPALRSRMSAAARTRSRFFSLDETAARLAQVYRRVAAGGGAAA